METYYCPKCGKEAQHCVASSFLAVSWGISARRMDLSYFVCLNCRLVGTDWKLIREKVNDLYTERSNKKVHCYHALHREIKKFMQDKIIGWRKKRFGDTEARFTKKPSS